MVSSIRRWVAPVSLALACACNLALASQPAAEPILRVDPGEHTALISKIASDAAGRWLITASHDKTLRVWDLQDGRLASTFRQPIGAGNEGAATAVAITPDGQTIAVGGFFAVTADETVSLYLVDRGSGRLLRRISGLANVPYDLAFSPDGRLLAAALARRGLRLFDTSDGRLIAEDRDFGGLSANAVDFSADGRLIVTGSDGLVRLYRADAQRLSLMASQSAPGGKQPYGARFAPDGKRIAIGFYDTPAVNVLDGTTLNLLYAPDTTGVNGALANVAWSRDGRILFAAGRTIQSGRVAVRRWLDGGSGAAADLGVASNSIFGLSPLPDGRLAFSSASSWAVVNGKGERAIARTPAVADFRLNPDGIRLSPDGTQVRFPYALRGQSPAVFDIGTRAMLGHDVPQLSPAATSEPGLALTDWQHTTTPKLNGTSIAGLRPNETVRSAVVRPDKEGFVLGTDWHLRAFDRNGKQRWQTTIPDTAQSVNASNDGRWIVAAYADGTIRWHRAYDGIEQLAFYPHPDKRRWVLWSPSGYYDAAPGSEDLIGWHVNRGAEQAADFFPVSRFRNQFYRPDVMAAILAAGSEAQGVRRANEETGRKVQPAAIVQALPPVVEIITPESGVSTSQPKVTLRIALRSPDNAPVTAMRVRVNGLLQHDATDGNAASGPREITVNIPAADSEVQVFAENRNGVSTPATLRVSWVGAKPKPAAQPATTPAARVDDIAKPKLYVLAVGVSNYKNPKYKLDFAAKDAADFTDALKKQKGLLYRDVEVKLLTDAQASKDEVLGGLEWLRRQVTSRDVGMLYVAGHGVNDSTNSYYFLPHEADVAQLLRTGVAYNDIKVTLSNIAGKALFFIDTCHSGNVLGTTKTRGLTDVNAVVSDLASAENGVVVFTASTGRQLAQEDKAWGNGAFTKALVEGLLGKADFRNSGTITHKGLDYYVAERVKELTKGEQSPVSIAPQGVTDFPIAIVRN